MNTSAPCFCNKHCSSVLQVYEDRPSDILSALQPEAELLNTEKYNQTAIRLWVFSEMGDMVRITALLAMRIRNIRDSSGGKKCCARTSVVQFSSVQRFLEWPK